MWLDELAGDNGKDTALLVIIGELGDADDVIVDMSMARV